MFNMFTGGLNSSLDDIGEDETPIIASQEGDAPRLYEYGSLKEWNNIRVLDIDPNEDLEAPIHCRLRLTSLKNPCKYLAISYAWG